MTKKEALRDTGTDEWHAHDDFHDEIKAIAGLLDIQTHQQCSTGASHQRYTTYVVPKPTLTRGI